MKPLLAALSIVGLFISSAVAADVPAISHDDLKAAIAKKEVVIIDVNGTDSYKETHIPGAIDFAAHKDDLATVLPKNKDALVVAYCGNEHCKAYKQAANAAVELGYTNVKHYSPGIAGWKAKEAPKEPSSKS